MEEIQPGAGAADFAEGSRGSMFNRVYFRKYSTVLEDRELWL